jgi:hypothetical protein
MKRSLAFALWVFGLSIGLASAQTSAPKAAHTHSPDITVPLQERHGSGIHGTVTLHPQGKKTMVDVSMFSGPKHLRPALELYNGQDCVGTRPNKAIPLNPINTGQVSRTFVDIPFSAFRSRDFVVDVRDATQRAQASEACARVGP